VQKWGREARKWAGPADHAPLQADWALSTGWAIIAHTVAGGQCTDAVEAGIGADRLACTLHTGMGSGGLGWVKGGDWATYRMPDWVGRMSSVFMSLISLDMDVSARHT